MSDVNCPYCDEPQEICHDDGYGYEEDRDYEQNCSYCGNAFKFTTAISFNYEVYCHGDHNMEQCLPPHEDMWDCTRCDFYEVRRAKVCGAPGCTNWTNLKTGDDGMVRCDFHYGDLE